MECRRIVKVLFGRFSVISWISSAKQNSIHEATRNGTKQIVLRAWYTTGHAGRAVCQLSWVSQNTTLKFDFPGRDSKELDPPAIVGCKV